MAATSRLHLRSSARRSAGLEEPPATAIPNNSLPIAPRSKRLRESSLSDDNSTRSIKRQKFLFKGPVRPAIAVRTHIVKNLVAPPPKLRNEVVTPPSVNSQSINSQSINTSDSHNQYVPTDKLEGNAEAEDSVPEPVNSELREGQRNGKNDKRTLRSQDGGSRSKSELSLYFPNYDEIVSVEPKETEFLTVNTPVFITDEKTQPSPAASTATASNSRASALSTLNGSSQSFSAPKLNNAQVIDFSSIASNVPVPTIDPLPPTLYFKAHRRAERQEKQLRNIEKERAQHEKVQLDRLLEGLKGHDWLRVMGISGVTDTEKKIFEPKRDYFIKEVKTLIGKFKAWKEEEKRRKVEKDHTSVAEDDDEDEEREDDDASMPAKAAPSNGDYPPDLNDVDAWAARQLHQEATSSATPLPNPPPRRRRATQQTVINTPTSSSTAMMPPRPPSPPPDNKPFTSFYTKPYLREAAIGKHRKGRTRFAFGQPLPEVRERDFGLPSEMLTEEAIAASARRRRRLGRGSRGEG